MILKKGVLFCALLCLVACGGGGGGGGEEPEPEPRPQATPPSAVSLIFPENNTECTEGTVVNENISRIPFQWTLSQNTDTYEIVIRNLDTDDQSTFVASTNEADISLARGTPFEWFVISRANGVNETATSPTWRFFNEGPGIENYAPFPAQAIAPERGSFIDFTPTFVLIWEATDVDDDLESYEVFFGTDPNNLPSIGTSDIQEIEVDLIAGTTFFWQVLSVDSQGNTSTSELFEFRVN